LWSEELIQLFYTITDFCYNYQCFTVKLDSDLSDVSYVSDAVFRRTWVGLKIEIQEIHQNVRNPMFINRPTVS